MANNVEAVQFSSELIWHYHKEVNTDGQSVTYCGRYADAAMVKSIEDNWARVCRKCKSAKDKIVV